jgi:hypothetical protein
MISLIGKGFGGRVLRGTFGFERTENNRRIEKISY